jgi:hypothetical protein
MILCSALLNPSIRLARLSSSTSENALLRRQELPHFALHRGHFIPLFYGVSEIFLRPHETPL